MRNVYFLFAAMIFAHCLSAQTHLAWTTSEATPAAQLNRYITHATDASGNSYVINSTQGTNIYTTYRFFRYNSSGNKMWEYINDSCLNNCDEHYANVIPVNDGGALFIGTYGGLTGTIQLRIKRIGISGNLMWEKQWTSPYQSISNTISKLDNDGKLIVGMTVVANAVDEDDMAIAKFDTISGAHIWHCLVPNGDAATTITVYESLADMEIDSDNNIYGCGFGGNALAAIAKNYFFKVSAAGSLAYKKVADNSGIATFAKVLTLMPGRAVMLMETGGECILEYRALADGAAEFFVNIARDSAFVYPVDMLYKDDHLYVLNNFRYFIPDSTFAGFHWSNYRFMITKLQSNAWTVWQHGYHEDLDTLAPSTSGHGAVQLASCGDHLYVLSAQPKDTFSSHVIVSKIDTAGSLIWYETAAMDAQTGGMATDGDCEMYIARTIGVSSVIQKFGQSPAAVAPVAKIEDWEGYPNPATGIITIKRSVNNKGAVSYAVYNNIGMKIHTGVTSSDKFDIDLTHYPAGMYHISLKLENGAVSSLKIIKM